MDLQGTKDGTGSGYARAVVSQPNVIFNNAGRDATIAAAVEGQTLSMCSFYGTPGYAPLSPLNFQVLGAPGRDCQLGRMPPDA